MEEVYNNHYEENDPVNHVRNHTTSTERVGITKSTPYEFLNEDRQLNATTSHLSKYNSSMLYFY